MRILLTGASGFIGRHLLPALLAEGHEVVAAGRRAPALAHPRLSSIEADFTRDGDQSVWAARLAHTRAEVLINAAGLFREHGRQTFAAVHTDTPRALFAACAASGSVHTVIQLSALGADEAAESAYHLSKKAADDALASLPLQGFIVQPSLVYGKGGASARLFKTLASMPFTLRFGRAAQLVQPIHVDDLVQAIMALLHAPHTGSARRIALVGAQALPFTDYLASLRDAMGLGRLRVLPVPAWAARALAGAARLLPGSLFDPAALRMLERGSHAGSAATVALLGRLPRPVERFIDDAALERQAARLGWLLPVLRLSIAAVWLATALVSYGLYPVEASYELLARSGVPAAFAPLMLYGAATFDLLLGLAILLVRRRWVWGVQLALIGFYTVYIAFRLPEFLLHPYGPLTKNLPMLAAIWLLYELEEK